MKKISSIFILMILLGGLFTNISTYAASDYSTLVDFSFDYEDYHTFYDGLVIIELNIQGDYDYVRYDLSPGTDNYVRTESDTLVFQGLEDDFYRLRVKVYDKEGEYDFRSLKFYVEIYEQPEIHFIEPDDLATVHSNDVFIDFEFTGELDYFEYRLKNLTEQENVHNYRHGTNTYVLYDLPNGHYDFKVLYYDTKGNDYHESISFEVRGVPVYEPVEVNIFNPQNNEHLDIGVVDIDVEVEGDYYGFYFMIEDPEGAVNTSSYMTQTTECQVHFTQTGWHEVKIIIDGLDGEQYTERIMLFVTDTDRREHIEGLPFQRTTMPQNSTFDPYDNTFAFSNYSPTGSGQCAGMSLVTILAHYNELPMTAQKESEDYVTFYNSYNLSQEVVAAFDGNISTIDLDDSEVDKMIRFWQEASTSTSGGRRVIASTHINSSYIEENVNANWNTTSIIDINEQLENNDLVELLLGYRYEDEEEIHNGSHSVVIYKYDYYPDTQEMIYHIYDSNHPVHQEPDWDSTIKLKYNGFDWEMQYSGFDLDRNEAAFYASNSGLFHQYVGDNIIHIESFYFYTRAEEIIECAKQLTVIEESIEPVNSEVDENGEHLGDGTMSSWAVDEIEWLEGRQILDSTFGSYSSPITRGEFAIMIVELFEHLKQSHAYGLYSNNFTDIDGESNYMKECIMKANQLGIITGYPDGTFRANNIISREEIVVMFMRAFRKAGYTSFNYGDAGFSDVSDETHWATNDINALKNSGIINGIQNTYFGRIETASLEQVLVMVYRAITYLE